MSEVKSRGPISRILSQFVGGGFFALSLLLVFVITKFTTSILTRTPFFWGRTWLICASIAIFFGYILAFVQALFERGAAAAAVTPKKAGLDEFLPKDIPPDYVMSTGYGVVTGLLIFIVMEFYYFQNKGNDGFSYTLVRKLFQADQIGQHGYFAILFLILIAFVAAILGCLKLSHEKQRKPTLLVWRATSLFYFICLSADLFFIAPSVNKDTAFKPNHLILTAIILISVALLGATLQMGVHQMRRLAQRSRPDRVEDGILPEGSVLNVLQQIGIMLFFVILLLFARSAIQAYNLNGFCVQISLFHRKFNILPCDLPHPPHVSAVHPAKPVAIQPTKTPAAKILAVPPATKALPVATPKVSPTAPLPPTTPGPKTPSPTTPPTTTTTTTTMKTAPLSAGPSVAASMAKPGPKVGEPSVAAVQNPVLTPTDWVCLPTGAISTSSIYAGRCYLKDEINIARSSDRLVLVVAGTNASGEDVQTEVRSLASSLWQRPALASWHGRIVIMILQLPQLKRLSDQGQPSSVVRLFNDQAYPRTPDKHSARDDVEILALQGNSGALPPTQIPPTQIAAAAWSPIRQIWLVGTTLPPTACELYEVNRFGDMSPPLSCT